MLANGTTKLNNNESPCLHFTPTAGAHRWYSGDAPCGPAPSKAIGFMYSKTLHEGSHKTASGDDGEPPYKSSLPKQANVAHRY